MTNASVVLDIATLDVTYPNGTNALRGVSLRVGTGERLAVIGESGCGKTTIARTILGLLPSDSRVAGSAIVAGSDVLALSERAHRRLRGTTIGYVAQSPYDAMNPLWSVERNVAEAWRAVGCQPPTGHVVAALERLGINDAAARIRQRPFTWSGGMLQRAAIAAATAHRPALLVADEPTSALDAELASDILELLGSASVALLIITHDVHLVAQHVHRIVVCYAGRIVEDRAALDICEQPRHPYTRALLAARIEPGRPLGVPLDGDPPDLSQPIVGCSFAPRCPVAVERCLTEQPGLVDGVACHVVNDRG